MICDCEAYMPIIGNPYLYGNPFGGTALLGMMDEGGVDVVLTMASGYDGSDNATLRREMAGRPRILGCCYVDPTRGREAVAEFRMTVKEWGFRGLKLAFVPCDTVDDLMGAAREMEIPVTIHTNGNCPAISGLAGRFPEVPIIMEHMGYRHHVDLAVAAVRERPNLYLGTTVVAAAEPMAVKQAVQAVGAERVLFGSNAPWAIPYLGVAGIGRMGLRPADERLVLGENFARIYRL